MENILRENGYKLIAGVDEAGRGPLAGPVIAASVILPYPNKTSGIKDSKKLSPSKRERIYRDIFRDAVAIGIGIVEPHDIDRLNIFKATLYAMVQSVNKLSIKPDYILVDGIVKLDLPIPQSYVVKGDERITSISAASIIAKVIRDRIMLQYHKIYPLYNFASHKGYGTKEHLEAIKKYGPSPIHRKSFRGIKEFFLNRV